MRSKVLEERWDIYESRVDEWLSALSWAALITRRRGDRYVVIIRVFGK